MNENSHYHVPLSIPISLSCTLRLVHGCMLIVWLFFQLMFGLQNAQNLSKGPSQLCRSVYKKIKIGNPHILEAGAIKKLNSLNTECRIVQYEQNEDEQRIILTVHIKLSLFLVHLISKL